MPANNNLLVVSGPEAASILDGQETKVIDIIREAYETHAEGQTALPHSIFLRFPSQPRDRIIGLPAYVGGEHPVAGMKWVASFPGNLEQGLPRASATLVLNSTETGRPYAFLESSLISAQRTGASAALAAKTLTHRGTTELSLVGCGPINREVGRFTLAAMADISKVRLYDTDQERARTMAAEITAATGRETEVVPDITAAIKDSPLVSIATNALEPYLDDPALFAKNSVVLHVSLRDITPAVIASAINVVDDLDHVNREATSIHLASQAAGNTDFVAANLGDLLIGSKSLPESEQPIIFSPFGLGILDVKLGQYVHDEAVARGIGQTIINFLPEN